MVETEIDLGLRAEARVRPAQGKANELRLDGMAPREDQFRLGRMGRACQTCRVTVPRNWHSG